MSAWTDLSLPASENLHTFGRITALPRTVETGHFQTYALQQARLAREDAIAEHEYMALGGAFGRRDERQPKLIMRLNRGAGAFRVARDTEPSKN